LDDTDQLFKRAGKRDNLLQIRVPGQQGGQQQEGLVA
jgi:hypothetical protein